jgi:murein DD-endopeptidase MepM/ murein hydrolase activator NlpD
MRKSKLYRFSHESLTFEETRWTKFRLIAVGLLLGGMLLWLVIVFNQFYGDVLGLGFIQQNAIVNENRVLQNQLQFLTRHLETVQKQLNLLGEKGNELRLLTDLPKFDEDLQKAGAGGTEERIDFTSSASVNTLLNNLRSTLGQAERELSFQEASYEDIKKTYEQNKIRFAHLPAIKPMDGFYHYHDFGMRLHPILNIYRKHEGIDIINESGSAIFASADGVVEFSGRRGGYGMTVEINHGFSFKTLYGHLSKILVHEGQRVKRGELIARSGNTGLSNGPHLHYEVRINGIAQNPTDYFFDDVKASDFRKLQ